jgi:hypothetical protein
MKKSPLIHLPKGAFRFLPLVFLCGLAHGTMIHFQANLSGPAESPANASPGMGFADVFFDDTAQTMEVKVSFWDLLGTATASHIHAATTLPNAGTAGVATETPTFGGFPLGVKSGTYDHLFDLTLAQSFNPSFVTANGGTNASASAAFESALLAEKAYLNIHTSVFPGGEIRGFLHAVPDGSSTALLLMVAFVGMAGVARFQRKPLS